MSGALLLAQAAVDSLPAYREFPAIGSRAAVWITAEVHLMFAAFVLGVPMFAVVPDSRSVPGSSFVNTAEMFIDAARVIVAPVSTPIVAAPPIVTS